MLSQRLSAKSNRQSTAGLTLAELIVSIAILGLLGSVVLVGLLQNQKIAASNRSLMAASLVLRQCTEYFQVCDSDDPMLSITGETFASDGFDVLFEDDANASKVGHQVALMLDDDSAAPMLEGTITRQIQTIAGSASSQNRLLGAVFRVEYTNSRGVQQVREIITNRAVP